MQITLLGQTDKRAVLYTLLRMCENLGDCAVVTNDRKLMRLMEEGPSDQGTYRNIQIFVADTTPDDVWQDIGYAPSDFEFVFLDNIWSERTELTIYVKGAGDEEEDRYTLDMLEPEDYVTIKMGSPDKAKGKKFGVKKKSEDTSVSKTYNIPYEKAMLENLEHCEFYKELKQITQTATKVCAAIMAEHTNVPLKTLGKVGTPKA